jgi:cyclopropane fatty-acyl-phospholipid synthase-like methyltransferase
MFYGRFVEQLIRRLAERPKPFAAGDAQLWTDPRVAPQLLSAHLDPTTDAASRRPERIAREVEWLVTALELRPGARVLDLGCGPGLYCESLAVRGLDMTGVDAAGGSLEHARRSAAAAGLGIRYVECDYRMFDERDAYDAAILVYLDFGVLSPDDRRLVLGRVRDALHPGGRFAFDVVSTTAARFETTSWNANAGAGFWRPGPHLVLERRLDYPDEQVYGTEYAVIDADADATVYRIWEQRFSRESIEHLLTENRFELEQVAGDLTGSPWRAELEMLAVVARRC